MADFLHAYKHLIANEGGYANVKGDKGGMTYMGIARNAHSDWKGWAIVENNLPLDHNEVINDDALSYMVKTFYKSNYWDRVKGDSITDQKVAEFVFDFFVNSGGRAIKSLQSVLGLVVDGGFGPKTLKAVNDYPGTDLVERLKADRLQFVRNIVKADPSQRKFLKGWEARINRF